MSHWAEVDDNNVVIRVLVGDNDLPNEGGDYFHEVLGGRWLQTSANTYKGLHGLGKTPFRGNFAVVGSVYIPEKDIFLPPKPYPSWVADFEYHDWVPPKPRPDSGIWRWDEESLSWLEGLPVYTYDIQA